MDVFVATPSYDEWFCMEYTSSLMETAVRLTLAGVGVYHSVAPGNPFLEIARNQLVEKFLATDAENLLFVDADVGWDAKAVLRVLKAPHEVVGGLVPKRDAKKDDVYHMNALTGGRDDFLLEAIEIPTAFMRIKRSVFEKWQELNAGVPYFGRGPSPHSTNPRDTGEDIWFCREWVHMGGTMWVDPDITFSHRGGKAWKGNFWDHCVNSGLVKSVEAA